MWTGGGAEEMGAASRTSQRAAAKRRAVQRRNFVTVMESRKVNERLAAVSRRPMLDPRDEIQ
jgi:hypothetical protein